MGSLIPGKVLKPEYQNGAIPLGLPMDSYYMDAPTPTQTSTQTSTPTSSNSGINTYLTQFFQNNPAMLAKLSNMSSNQGMASSDIPSMVSHYNNLANSSDFVHAKHGGRIGYDDGGSTSENVYRPAKKAYNSIYGHDVNGNPVYVKDLYDDFNSFLEVFKTHYHADGGRIGYEQGKLVEPQTPSRDYRPMQLIQTFTDAKSRGDEDTANLAAHSLWSEYKFNILPGKKDGGRIKKNMGGTLGQPEIYTPTQDTMMSRNIPNEGLMSIKLTPVNKKKGGKIIQHPVRMLEDGHPELDLRAKGGYIPIGKKERADDVPAMLSKNEFVFTADAVRNAGDGDVNKGAQKMYKLMKSLEGKIKRHG